MCQAFLKMSQKNQNISTVKSGAFVAFGAGPQTLLLAGGAEGLAALFPCGIG